MSTPSDMAFLQKLKEIKTFLDRTCIGAAVTKPFKKPLEGWGKKDKFRREIWVVQKERH